MYKVTITYISNVPVKLFLEHGDLTAKEKTALAKVSANAVKKGEITEPFSRTHEFAGKKIGHSVVFTDEAAYGRYVDAQEKAVPGYLARRASYYEKSHIAVNEKGVTE